MKFRLFSLCLAAACAWTSAPAPAQPAAPAARPASAFSAGVANEWFSLALLLTQQTPGFSPAVASRAFA